MIPIEDLPGRYNLTDNEKRSFLDTNITVRKKYIPMKIICITIEQLSGEFVNNLRKDMKLYISDIHYPIGKGYQSLIERASILCYSVDVYC